MAPVDAGDFRLDEDDEDYFGEYNPQPYRGGYDLAATFGTPLPPSANICYPVSSSAATAVSSTPLPPSPKPAPADPPPEEPYGVKEAPREPVHGSPEVSPNEATAREGKRQKGDQWKRRFLRKCVRALDYLFCYKDPYGEQRIMADRKEGKRQRGGQWKRRFLRKCVRALDYLFCYKDPYGEQRIVADSYVVPVYAKRKESGKDSLSVEVEAHDANEELDQSNDLPWHTNNRDESNAYSQSISSSYCTPFMQSYRLPGVWGKPDWFLNSSYSEFHQTEEFQHEAPLSYNVEHKISGQPIRCYHHHCCRPPLNAQVEPLEPVSSQRLEHYEHFSTYRDESDRHPPAQAYDIQSYAPISDVPLESFKPSWSQNWGLYAAYTQGNALENNTNSLTFGEYGGIGSLFISPFHPDEAEAFELATSVEHASFQHNWHNLSYQNMPMDDVSLITEPADDSYSMNGSIWPFVEHSPYSV